MTLETSAGTGLSLERAPGGLRARLATHREHAREWTILGASRGEEGILREGVSQALVGDGPYRAALDAAARALAPSDPSRRLR